MEYFPLFVNLDQVLIIGAGEVATRKVELLLKTKSRLTVIAPVATSAILEFASMNQLTYRSENFNADCLCDYSVIVCATNNQLLNQSIAKQALAMNKWVNVVDAPKDGNFIFPSIIDRSPILIGIVSGAASPVLTRLLRAKIEAMLPFEYGELAKLGAKFRSVVKNKISSPKKRRIFWETVYQGPISESVFNGNLSMAERQLEAYLESPSHGESDRGEVYLIGAGPGDPELLTFKSVRLMQQADVVVYDRLVPASILELARRDSQKIYVGKESGNHSLPQEDINQLLVNLALEGKRVARLKGGDPFIFGRGGEEIESLIKHEITFQVVPGITAANGCASYAGIPLTHRNHAQMCTFVTGHLKDGTIDLNWPQLAHPNQTVVIYMGLQGLPYICAKFIEYGLPINHPIAIIQQGTTQNQKVLTGTLQTIGAIVENEMIISPTLIVVGTVVSLRSSLKWFDKA